jgi:Na+-driven multidrug efflux pump
MEVVNIMNATNSQNLFETTSLNKLMMKFSIPCILSLLIASLYNMVDQVFIGRGVGYLGNGATTVVYPVTVIALAIALWIGDGCAAHLSICQGKKEQEQANRSVANAIVSVLVLSIIVLILGFAFEQQILQIFGATENNYTYAKEYFDIILLGIPFYMFGSTMNSIIRADGSPQFALMSTLLGCIMNVILDPIAIFVLHWGMKGAAIATIAGQIATALLTFGYLFHSKNVKLNKNSFRLNAGTLKMISTLGISSFLTQISIVLIMAVMNNALVKYGAESKYGADIPLTVVGIVMKMFAIAIAFIVGVAAGCQPIVGYNQGAGRLDRVKEIYKKMMLVEFAIGLVATLCFELFPIQLINLFGSDNGALYNEFAVLAFRIYLSSMVLCAIQKASSIFLQSIGKPLQAMILSLARDFVLLAPMCIILPIRFGVVGPLYSAPIADVICLVITVIVIAYTFKKMGISGSHERVAHSSYVSVEQNA